MIAPKRWTPAARLMTRKEVAERMGVHLSTTYTMPGFPTPIRLTASTVRFDPEDVEHYMATRRTEK